MQEKFNYTYSAKEQAELEAIRKKYLAPEQKPDKLEAIRKLDRKAELTATLTAIGIGLTGTLILGTGLSLVLKFALFLPGILIGMTGLVIMALAPAVFRKTGEIQRKKVAPEILRLSEEIEKHL
ncbi:MAG: hypothetical protein IJ642_09945 [Oscillospiraceae bacterium]|nr:hypothetical protein [Oscillospiraceae bacterium]